MIRKLLIANRGEITCRIMRTCRQMGILTVAVFSEIDRDALHVELADEAIYIGDSPATESYLNIGNIITAAERAGADAIHPGYGFLAENASFAQAVIDAGLTWVGPQPDVIAAMGDKRQAKQLLNDIPYVPGYTGDDQSDETLINAAAEIGYPVMIKAAAGGGGKGMRAVANPDDMVQSLAAARREAQQAFGDSTLMLEKQVINPRHIEVQIIGDHHGNVMALGERECSIQRRHQKIIEESPASNLDDDLRHAIHETAVAVGRQLDYQNAGTVEFLLDQDGNFYFMEMNTRLQVEHPVTEVVYAIDLVRWQLEIAQGTPLGELIPPFADTDDFAYMPDGHAIEVRIYTEDPANEFLPVTGKILHWDAPDTVRVDAGIRSGDRISTYYDPMIAKIIAHGHDRTTAIRKLDTALAHLQLIGMRNNVSFLRRVLTHDKHVDGEISTQFLDQYSELMQDDVVCPPASMIAVAFAKSGTGNRWRNNPNRPIRHRFVTGDESFEVLLSTQGKVYKAQIGDNDYSVMVNHAGEQTITLTVDGYRQVFTVIEGDNEQWWVHSLAGTYKLEWQNPLPLPGAKIVTEGSLRAPMPGQVISLNVEAGQTVSQGDVLLILEAMKMEHRIIAPHDGTVETIAYSVGDTVQQDDELISITRHTE